MSAQRVLHRRRRTRWGRASRRWPPPSPNGCGADGVDPVVVREPGGTPAAEALRQALARSGPSASSLRPSCCTSARPGPTLCSEVIRPALAAGRVVLSDRFELSTQAYQVAGRGLDRQTVAVVNAAATGGLQPDLTLVIDLPPEVGLARQHGAGSAGIGWTGGDRAFHRRVADAYLAAAGEGCDIWMDGRRPDQCRRRHGPPLAAAVGRNVSGPRSRITAGGGMKQRWSLIGAGGGHLVLERRLAAPARRGGRRQRLPAGAPVRRRALATSHSYYVDSLAETELYHKATNGMLEQLKDPYSVLLIGRRLQAAHRTDLRQLRRPRHPDRRARRLDHRGGAASRDAGRAGRRARPATRSSRSTASRTEGWNNEQARQGAARRGRAARSRSDRRAGIAEPIRYELTRAQIHIRSVPPGTLFESGIGYISLNPVSETSADELRARDHVDDAEGNEVADLRPAAQPRAACSTRASRSPTCSSIPARRSSPPGAGPAARPAVLR